MKNPLEKLQKNMYFVWWFAIIIACLNRFYYILYTLVLCALEIIIIKLYTNYIGIYL